MTPPNVLLIVTDQWRADGLGFDGHPVVQTPHLDDLFLNGVHFRQAYSAVPTCIAARAALLTGLHQRHHRRVGYQDGVPWDYPTTVAGAFANAGYHTQCVGKMHVYPTRSLMGFHNVVLHNGTLGHDRGCGRDYDEFDDYRPWLRSKVGADADLLDTGMGANAFSVNPWPYPEMTHPTNWVASQSIDFLRRRDTTKPFFLKMSFVRPHAPYDPPAAYYDIYRDSELPPVPVGDWADRDDPHRGGLNNLTPHRGIVNPALHDRARRAYYALITQIDHQINRVLLTLRHQGLFDNTVILFCSDHGELLGDHHLWAKARPFDGSARVPFLMRLPSSMGIERRRVIHHPVELRDIFPTLCDAAGIPIPEAVDGRSVMPLLRGDDVPWRDFIHGEHRHWRGADQWLTDGREKFCWDSNTGDELLFDLEQDPQERFNLAVERGDRTRFWREQLIRQLADREEGYVKDGALQRVDSHLPAVLREDYPEFTETFAG